MKKIIFLPALILHSITGFCQEVMRVQGGATVTLQAGADMTILGGILLDKGSQLVNNGVFTIKQNGISGTGDFVDNSAVFYNYGAGKFVFNGTVNQSVLSNNNFGRIDVNTAGLTLSSSVTAGKWWLANGRVNTGLFKAIVSGTDSSALEAAPGNENFSNSWINGNLRRYINPTAVNNYKFAIGGSTVKNFAELNNLTTNPLTGVQYIDASFGPKAGTDDGLAATENGTLYTSVNEAGVWHFDPSNTPSDGKYDLKLFLDGFTGLSDNGFAPLQRPGASASAAEWNVPQGSSINADNGAGRLTSAGYSLRKGLAALGQFGIGQFTGSTTTGGTGLQGVYYNGITLSGTPLLTRIDPTINFDLSYKSPAPGIVPADGYSVKWTGQVQAVYSEIYTFYTSSDDGIRLWVNGVQLVDNWVNQGTTEKSGSIYLAAGQKYDIVIEYYEAAGDAVTKLSWSGPSTPKAIVPQSQLYPPGTVTPPPAGTGLQGVYYNGITLSGTPLLTRIDPTINFDLSYKSPAPGIVPADAYSVRWTGQVQAVYSETYTFYTSSDDGIRLWVNGVQLVDNWVNQGATEKSGSIYLAAGQKYDIVIEYYEAAGDAVTKLSWSGPSTAKAIVPQSQLYPPGAVTPPPAGIGLQGVYYSGSNLSGAPLLTRIDPTINFDLSYKSPAPGIVPQDGYSVRWTGQVQPLYSETYTFYTTADDGIRLWVSGVKLIDNWVNQGATEKSGSITLVAGQKYDIVIEYYEAAGDAVTKLAWSGASTPKAIIPASQLFPPGPVPGTAICVINSSPANGATIPSQTTAALTWGKIPAAASYDVYIWSGTSAPASATANVLGTAYNATGLVAGTLYNWFIAPVNVTGAVTTCGATNTSSFLTAVVNGQCLTNTSPADGSILSTSTTAALAWTAYPTATLYDIYLWRNNTPVSVIHFRVPASNGTYYFADGLTPDTEYFWYVVPGIESGADIGCNIFKGTIFRTNASAARVMDVLAPANVITSLSKTDTSSSLPSVSAVISPNPVATGQQAKLQINSNKAGVVMVNIFGSNGAITGTKKVNLVAGINTTMVNTYGLAQGLHVISITGCAKPWNLKLLVQ